MRFLGAAVTTVCGALILGSMDASAQPLASIETPSASDPADLAVESNRGESRVMFTLPLPPGTGGFVPPLSLRYSSLGPDGPFGVGWSLELGEVRRATRFGPPAYDDASDRFEFGGELLVVNAAESTATHTRYHTLTETFVRVDHHHDGAQDFWEVTRPNGVVMRFGLDDGARIRRDGSTGPIFRWLLSEIEDANGNVVAATHLIEDGTAYPLSFRYTLRGPSREPVGTLREIAFSYESRPDPVVSLAGGVWSRMARRASAIEVTVGGEIFRRVELAYSDQAGALKDYDSGRSRLDRIQLFGVGGVESMPPQRFEYRDTSDTLGSGSHFASEAFVLPTPARDAAGADLGVRFAEVNGDGRVDLLRAYQDAGGTLVQDVYLGNGAGWSSTPDAAWSQALAAVVGTTSEEIVTTDRLLGPFSRPDLGFFIQTYYEGVPIACRPSDRLFRNEVPSPVLFADAQQRFLVTPLQRNTRTSHTLPPQWRVVDINGDGRADLVSSTGASARVFNFVCEHGDPSPTDLAPGYRSSALRQLGPTFGEVWLNTGSSWARDDALSASLPTFASTSVKGAVKIFDHHPRFPDLDGDGRADLVVMDKFFSGDSHVYVSRAYLNTEDGFVRAPELDPPLDHRAISGDNPATPFALGDEDQGVRFVDLNRDGFADFVESAMTGALSQSVFLSTGSSWCGPGDGCDTARFLPPIALAAFGVDERYAFRDADGDGFVDLLGLGTQGVRRSFRHDPGGEPTVWVEDARFAVPGSTQRALLDANADGALDSVSLRGETSYRGRARFADLLSRMDNGLGGKVAYGYESAAAVQDTFLDLAADDVLQELDGGFQGQVLWTTKPVLRVREFSGVGVIPSAQEFAYAKPRVLPGMRASLGFAFVEATIPGRRSRQLYFAQRHGISGRVLRQSVLSLSDSDFGERLRIENRYEVLDGADPDVFAGSTAGVSVGRLVSTTSRRMYGPDVFGGGPAEQPGAVTRTELEYDPKNGDSFAGYSFVTRTTVTRPSGTLITTNTLAQPDTARWIVGLNARVHLSDGGRELATTSFDYDVNGRLIETSALDGARGDLGNAVVRTTTRSYDVYGNVVSITDAAGRTDEFCYDGSDGFPSGVACGGTTSGSFSTMTATLDAREEITRMARDPVTGKVVEIVREYSGDRERMTFDAFGRERVRSIVPAGGAELTLSTTTHVDLDDSAIGQPYRERVLAVDDQDETLRSAVYFDGFGRTVRSVDEAPRRDGQRRYRGVATRIDTMSSEVITSYLGACGTDPHCRAVYATVASRLEQRFDALGRLVEQTSPDGTERTYYTRVERVSPGQPQGPDAVPQAYDALLRLDPAGGLLQHVSDQERLVWTEECNNAPLDPTTADLAQVTCQSPTTTTYRYEATGEVAAVFDALADLALPGSARVRFVYDSMGRVVERHDSDKAQPVLTGFDAAGNPVQSVNARGDLVTAEYDELDRLSALSYDDAGTPRSYTLEYDSASRMVSRVAQWEGASTRLSLQQFTYDALRRRTSESLQHLDHPALVAQVDYDRLGRVIEMRYPDAGTTVRYEYEGAYLKRVLEPASGGGCEEDTSSVYLSDVRYDELGRETELAGPALGGVAAPILRLDYDPLTYRLQHFGLQTVESPASETIDLSYNHNALGQVSDITDASVVSSGGDVDFGVSYTYDARGRLTSRTRAGETRYYTYDPLGNLTGKRVAAPGAVNQSYSAARPHQLLEASGVGYAHDADGNVTQRGAQGLIFDALNRATEIDTNGARDRFVYGLDDVRVAGGGGVTAERVFLGDFFEWNPRTGEATARIFALGRLIAYKKIGDAELRSGLAIGGVGIETLAGSTLNLLATVALALLLMVVARAARHVVGLPRPLVAATALSLVAAMLAGALLPARLLADFDTPSGQGNYRRFVWADPLGSSLHITDETGNVVRQQAFEPFGELAGDRSSESTERFFATHPFEEGLQLYPMQARLYDPAAGRFMSGDSVVRELAEPQSLNPYSYVENDPVNLIDLDGRVPLIPVVIGVIRFGPTAIRLGGAVIGAFARQRALVGAGKLVGRASALTPQQLAVAGLGVSVVKDIANTVAGAPPGVDVLPIPGTGGFFDTGVALFDGAIGLGKLGIENGGIQQLGSAISGTADAIGAGFTGIGNVVASSLDFVFGSFEGSSGPRAVVNGITSDGTVFGDGTALPFNGEDSAFGAIAADTPSGFVAFGDFVDGQLGALGGGVVGTISGAFGAVSSGVSSVIGSIGGAFSGGCSPTALGATPNLGFLLWLLLPIQLLLWLRLRGRRRSACRMTTGSSAPRDDSGR